MRTALGGSLKSAERRIHARCSRPRTDAALSGRAAERGSPFFREVTMGLTNSQIDDFVRLTLKSLSNSHNRISVKKQVPQINDLIAAEKVRIAQDNDNYFPEKQMN